MTGEMYREQVLQHEKYTNGNYHTVCDTKVSFLQNYVSPKHQKEASQDDPDENHKDDEELEVP